MNYKIEVVTVPVADVDRAAVFYTEKAGFTLDVDYHLVDGFWVVQLTPRSPWSPPARRCGEGPSERRDPGLRRARSQRRGPGPGQVPRTDPPPRSPGQPRWPPRP